MCHKTSAKLALFPEFSKYFVAFLMFLFVNYCFPRVIDISNLFSQSFDVLLGGSTTIPFMSSSLRSIAAYFPIDPWLVIWWRHLDINSRSRHPLSALFASTTSTSYFDSDVTMFCLTHSGSSEKMKNFTPGTLCFNNLAASAI